MLIRMTVFREVRAVYMAVIGKMLAKFPFNCEVLKDLVVMDLTNRADITYTPCKSSCGVTVWYLTW